MHVGDLFLYIFCSGFLLAIVSLSFNQWLIYKYMRQLDVLIGGLDDPVFQSLWFRNLRLVNYMGAAASRWSNRRGLPEYDFSTLEPTMRRRLAFGFWLFATSFVLAFGSFALEFVFVETGWVTVDGRLSDGAD